MNDRDVVASAGVADLTAIDTFIGMQGKSTFLTMDDLDAEISANDEVLYDADGMAYVSEDDTGRYEQED